jgi:hypothetical protein
VATTSSFELHYLIQLCIDNVILPCSLPEFLMTIQLVSLGILKIPSFTIA